MEQLPTAEEFLSNVIIDIDSSEEPCYTGKETIGLMIEFAKLHVEAALNSASKSAKITERKKIIDSTGGYVRIPTIYNKCILNSYPPENIK